MILSFVGPVSWLYADTAKACPSWHKSQRSPFEKEVTVYRYFEKGWRKKFTRQCRKVLWVVLSSLFFNEMRKNDTRLSSCTYVWSTKGKQQKYFRQLQYQEMSGTVCWLYPILPFGIVACTFFPTTFLETAEKCNVMFNICWNRPRWLSFGP